MNNNLSDAYKLEILFWFCSLTLGLGIGIFLQEYGLAATHESIEFLDASLGFLKGEINLSPTRAPLYPFLLSIFSLLRLPAEAACFVNGIAAAFLITSFIRIAHFLKIPWYGLILVGIFPVIWTDIGHVFQAIWSEGTFVSLICLHFVYLQKYLRRPKISAWFVAMLMASLALSTQYIGYCLIPHTFFILWYFRKNVDLPQHIFASIVAFSPHLMWLIYNNFRADSFYGKRYPSPFSLGDNIEQFLRTTMECFGSGLGIIIFAVVALFLWQNPRQKLKANPPKALLIYSICSCLFFFSILLILSTSAVAIDKVNARLSSPIYSLVFLLSLFGSSHVWLLIGKPQHFTTLTCLGIMIFSIALGKQIGVPDRDALKWINAYKNQKEESYVSLMGINKTSTVLNLQKTIFTEIEGKDHINVIWFEEPKYNLDFKLLLYREILQSEHLKIGKIHSQVGRIQAALETTHGLILLSVHNSGSIENVNELKSRIETIFKTSKDQDILLVGQRYSLKSLQALEFSWEKKTSENTKFFECKTKYTPNPYILLKCQVKHSREHTPEKQEPPIPEREASKYKIPETLSAESPKPDEFIGLEISEIMVYPEKVKKWRGEWFEVQNTTTKSMNLLGIEFLSKDDKGFKVVEDIIVSPSEYALFAMRKNPDLNGGLPTPDYIYLETELSVESKDWLEIRYNNQVIDHVDIKGEMIENGASIMKFENEFCVAVTKYGRGDRGTPKAANHCTK